MINELRWSEIQESNRDCPYTHVVALTPFGRFLITWKGWKDNDCPTIDETPWGQFGGVGDDLVEAKEIAEAQFRLRVEKCLSI